MKARVPRVSIAVPSYNGAEFLARSISSVLNQSLHDFEIVVSDDGSTDSSIDVLASFDDDRLRVFPGERIGPEANWNRAVSLTRGEYIKLLPQDDILHPECLERQVTALEMHPGVGLAACRRDVIGPDDTVVLRSRGLSGLKGPVPPRRAISAIVRSGTNLVGEGAAVLMRRTAFADAGGFRGKRPYVIDLDLWVRIIQRTGLYAEREALASFRVSPNAWTANLSSVQTDQMRSLFSHLKDDPQNDIGPLAYSIGWVKAGLNTPLRRAVYRRLARKHRNRSITDSTW